MGGPPGRIVIYTRKIDEMAAFYCRHFGYERLHIEGDRIVELRPQGRGLTLLLHPASKGQKIGQSLIKLVFDVEDVEAFCATAREDGLVFGPVHKADGYHFATPRIRPAIPSRCRAGHFTSSDVRGYRRRVA